MTMEELCDAQHPDYPDVYCTELPGPNAQDRDENGDPKGEPVHVHRGMGASGSHRWEDVA
jgi:hypothetical protein